jgi:hypothetical protein
MYFIISDENDNFLMLHGNLPELKCNTGLNHVDDHINNHLKPIYYKYDTQDVCIILRNYLGVMCNNYKHGMQTLICDPLYKTLAEGKSDAYENISHVRTVIATPTNKIILGEKYSLFNAKIIKKFNLIIIPDYISYLCYHGRIDTLESLIKKNLPLKYDEDALFWASAKGHTHVLEWWFKSNLPLKYNEWTLYIASVNLHINVLNWWKNSGLPLKYFNDVVFNIQYLYEHGHVEIIEWWKNSGLIQNLS